MTSTYEADAEISQMRISAKIFQPGGKNHFYTKPRE